MVASVARVPRPRTLQEPVQTLCARLRAELANLDASHPALNLMTDVHTADRLEDAIAEVRRRRMAQPQQSEMVGRLQVEYYAKQQRFHNAWLEWRDNRKKAWQIEHSASQAIMQLLPDDWAERDFAQLDMRVGGPRFMDFDEAKRANADLETKILELEQFNSRFSEAFQFQNMPTGDQAHAMCTKHFRKLDHLANLVFKLQDEIKELKRSHKPAKE